MMDKLIKIKTNENIYIFNTIEINNLKFSLEIINCFKLYFVKIKLIMLLLILK